jgi:hypothetical protein
MPVTRTLITAEYAMLRLPLTVLENRVVGRYLDAESRLRLGFENALGTLDATVGRLVGDPALTRRGAQLSHKAQILEKAVVLEEKAAARKEEADAGLKEAKAAAERKRTAARARAQADVKHIRQEQQSVKRAAAERADAEVRARAEVIERETEAKLQAADQRAAEQVQRIAQRTQTRTAKPKAQLKDASELAQSAIKERAAAERLSELADEEKARRKEG